MSDRLVFDMQVRVDRKGTKDAEAFVNKVTKGLKDIPVTFDVQSGVRGLRAIKSAAKDAETSASRLFSIMEKNAAQTNKVLRTEVDLLGEIAKIKRKDFAAELESRNIRLKSAAKELTQLEQMDARIKQNTEARRKQIKVEEDYRKSIIERQKAREYEDEQRFRSGASSNVHGASSNEAIIDRQIDKRNREIAAADKKLSDKRLKLQEDYQHRATILGIQYDQRDSQMLVQHQARINAIMQAGATKNIATLRRELEIENILLAKGMQQQAQQKQQYTLFGTKFGNKTNQNLFMVQQAIEDFSYAGIRGASNNLAMMASTMGGPGGLIALGTVLGITVVPTLIESFGLLEHSAFNADKRLEKMGERFERLKKVREGYESGLSTFSVGTSGFDLRGKMTENEDKMLSAESQQEALVNKMNTLRQFYKELHNFNSSMAGTWAGDGPDRSKIEALSKELEALGYTAQNLKDMEGFGIRSAKTGSADPTVMDPLKKEAQDLQDQLVLLEKVNKAYEDKALFFHTLSLGQDRLNRGFERGVDLESKLSGNALEGQSGKGYGNLLSDIMYERDVQKEGVDFKTDNAIQKRMNIIKNLMVHHAEEEGTAEAIARLEQEILDLQAKRAEKYGDINSKSQKEVDALIEKRNLIADIQFKVREEIDAVEERIEAEKRLQEQIKSRIETMLKARDAQVQSFAGANFQSSMSIAGKQFDEEMEGFNAQEAQREQQEAMQLEMARRMGYNTTGMEKYLDASREQRRSQFKQGHAQRFQQRQSQLQNQYQGSLRDRANKLGNDPEAQLEALRELEAFQRQRIGSAGSSGEMQMFDNQAKQTQEEILILMDKMRMAEEKRLAESQAKQKKEEERLTMLNTAMTQISNINIFNESEKALERIIQKLAASGINLGAIGAAAGAPPAPVQAPKPGAPAVSSTTNNYNVSVAGIPQRQSLTMGDLARQAAAQAAANKMRTGFA